MKVVNHVMVQAVLGKDEIESLLSFAAKRMGTVGNIWRTKNNLYAFISFPHTANTFHQYYLYTPKGENARQPYWKRSG